jgi:NAD(P)-dependent dehydrogenase (short-subunit alcohol dehydrogenase family)
VLVPLALITGASTGIGAATASRLARGGWTVLAGVRDTRAGEMLLEQAPSGTILPVELDVTQAGQIDAVSKRIRGGVAGASVAGGLDALINNAGIGVGGPLEVVQDAELRRQFDVNVFGQLAVTRAMLGALRAARGRIVFTSSIGGRVAMAYTAPYAASKHAIEAFADALRVELVRSHIQVALIEPGSVATPIWEKGREEAQRLTIPAELSPQYGHVPAALGKALQDTARRGVPPDLVAATIERALQARRMRARYLVGRDAHVMLALKRALPDRVFDRFARRALGV